MSALGKVVRAGVGRRRVQTLVMTLTTMLAVTAAVLAAGLIVASEAPFDNAFARRRGAHLTVRFDVTKTTAAQLAATTRVQDVTAAAGPDPVLSLRPRFGDDEGPGTGAPPITVVGRATPDAPVDALDLIEGKWATAPGQIVLAAGDLPVEIGARMSFPGVRGRTVLTVVGRARSVGKSAEAWVSPAQLAALTAPGTVPGHQMRYRFKHAGTDAEVTADRVALAAAVPPGSMTGVASYLKVKKSVERQGKTYVPFVLAFGLLGLCMSVLIIAVVVGGAVGAATRRIGVLKALGFTPAQVVRAYVGQALIPGVAGTLLGVALGNLLATPVLRDVGEAYGTGAATVAWWIDLAVPAAALAVVALTALAPASRAGRLRAAEAIAVGRTPRAGRGRMIGRLLARPPLPRAVSLGLAVPFARPARSATTAAAVVLGVVGVTLGVGLTLSLNGIQQGLERRSPGDVVVRTIGPPRSSHPPKAADPAATAAKIGAQPGTRRSFGIGQTRLGVAGLTGATTVLAYTGDASWSSYQMIAGSWFHRPGEAVVPTGFLKSTGTRLGDTITLTDGARHASVRLVGESLDLREEGMVVLTDRASLTGLQVPPPDEFGVELKPGTDAGAYVRALNGVLEPMGANAQANSPGLNPTIIAMDALAGTLTAMLVAVAGLGVLNTVVLDTRERVHDLGVFKALGMSPRQTVTMVVTSVAGLGLAAAALGVPLGMALHAAILPAMGDAAGTRIPSEDLAVYDVPLLAVLLLGGPLIATAGALLPATWAARTRTATALRTE